MGLMSRMKNIFEAKANKVMDELENPIEQLELSIKNREESINETKRKSSAFIGSSTSLKNEIEGLKTKLKNYKKVAIVKAKDGDQDGFAKWHGLEIRTEEEINFKEARLMKIQEESEIIIGKLKSMEAEIEKLKNKKEELKARYSTAKTIGGINEALAGIDNKMPSVDNIEKKVIEKENYASGLNTFISKSEDEEIASILSKSVNSDKLASEMEKYKSL